MPAARSLLSSRALPPVSAAIDQSVSWDRWKFEVDASAEAPVYMPRPPGDPLVASPRGACATSPRASTGHRDTPARMAALMVACSCAWLLTPFSRRPLEK